MRHRAPCPGNRAKRAERVGRRPRYPAARGGACQGSCQGSRTGGLTRYATARWRGGQAGAHGTPSAGTAAFLAAVGLNEPSAGLPRRPAGCRASRRGERGGDEHAGGFPCAGAGGLPSGCRAGCCQAYLAGVRSRDGDFRGSAGMIPPPMSQSARVLLLASGFLQRRPGKREKSASFECSSAWNSTASAARWAEVGGLEIIEKLSELADVDAGAEPAGQRLYGVRSSARLLPFLGGQTASSQDFVENGSKRRTPSVGQIPQLSGHIGIERHGRAHRGHHSSEFRAHHMHWSQSNDLFVECSGTRSPGPSIGMPVRGRMRSRLMHSDRCWRTCRAGGEPCGVNSSGMPCLPGIRDT